MKTKVATIHDIPEEDAISITLSDGKELLVCRLNGQIQVISNSCPHMGGPLGDGEIHDGKITCPWHGWKFDLLDGSCLNSPGECIDVFQVEIEGDDIFIIEDD